MDREALEAERARLQAMLKKRQTRPGFSDNVTAIEAKIEALDALLAEEA